MGGKLPRSPLVAASPPPPPPSRQGRGRVCCGRLVLIRKTFDANDKLTEIIFGIAERKRADVDSLTVQRLHSVIRDGLRFETLSEKIDNLESIILGVVANVGAYNATAKIEAEALLADRINEALSAVNLKTKPHIILSATPEQPVEINNLFEGRNSLSVQLLDMPPTIRDAGFDLNIGNVSRIVNGKLRRAVEPDYRLLELWRDGTLIFTATGDSDFLSWGQYAAETDPLRINDYAICESVYLFCKLAKEIYAQFSLPQKTTFQLKLDLISTNIPQHTLPLP